MKHKLITVILGVIIAVACTMSIVNAQVGLQPLTTYTQNFDTLVSNGVSATLPIGWALSESGSFANITYTAGTGSGTTGDTYSFGAAGSSERAFGGLQSGNLNPIIGVSFTNNTSGTIGQLSITYACEQWRLGAIGRTDRLDFQYSTNAISLTTGAWLDFDALDCTAPITGPAIGALDGNSASNRITVTAILSNTGVFSVPSLSTFWIRWTDFNATGSDDGIAVDDFSMSLFTPTAVTLRNITAAPNNAPLTVLLAALSLITLGIVLILRRRSRTA